MPSFKRATYFGGCRNGSSLSWSAFKLRHSLSDSKSLAFAASLSTLWSSTCNAQFEPTPMLSISYLELVASEPKIQFVLSLVFAAVILFSLAGIIHFWNKYKLTTLLIAMEKNQSSLRKQVEIAEQLLHGEDQLTLVLKLGNSGIVKSTKIFGSFGLVEDPSVATNSRKLMDFPRWIEAQDASELSDLIEDLTQNKTRFSTVIKTRNGELASVTGSLSSSSPVIRFRMLSEEMSDQAHLQVQYDRISKESDTLRALLDASPSPAWMRDEIGRLIWVNNAYAAATDAQDPHSAISNELELLDGETRSHLIKTQQKEMTATAQISTLIDGARRTLDVFDIRAKRGTAGMAIDISDVITARVDLDRVQQFHARTLDQLATPVAVFDVEQTLCFYNSAFVELWELDEDYLAQMPKEAELLNTLRGKRMLPEQPNFNSWRNEFLLHYQACEPIEHLWHLPDGTVLRVIVSPHPHGGLTQIYENVTEELHLKGQLKRVSDVQSETLDHLDEGVCVFASDGTLEICNPAFAEIWNLDADFVNSGVHIQPLQEKALSTFKTLSPETTSHWDLISTSITDVTDGRQSFGDQITCTPNMIIDYAVVPLPDGVTMVTFSDVTEKMKSKKRLEERNSALEAADQSRLKLIEHIAYALRAPLTNIIGFSELLAEPSFGSLNQKQDEYIKHILASSAILTSNIDDVLEYNAVEAGLLSPDLSEVSVNEVVDHLKSLFNQRAQDQNIALISSCEDDLTFTSDQDKVQQALSNILDNAIRFSKQNSKVYIRAFAQKEQLVFEIEDQGCGISAENRKTILKPFEGTSPDRGRRSFGIGLSLAQKFVEMHRGHLEINSELGKGTIVTCSFPIEPRLEAKAAA